MTKGIPAQDGGAAPTAQERRAIARRATHFKGRFQAKDGWVECVVSNLSVLGAKLTAAAYVGPTQHLSLVIDHCDPISAEVVWHDGAIGIRFTGDREEIARNLATHLGK
jgi:hypothetical protein